MVDDPELDREHVTLLVLLGLSTAFDTTDHRILLIYFSMLGLRDTMLEWPETYLGGWFQNVMFGYSSFAPWPVTKCISCLQWDYTSLEKPGLQLESATQPSIQIR